MKTSWEWTYENSWEFPQGSILTSIIISSCSNNLALCTFALIEQELEKYLLKTQVYEHKISASKIIIFLCVRPEQILYARSRPHSSTGKLLIWSLPISGSLMHTEHIPKLCKPWQRLSHIKFGVSKLHNGRFDCNFSHISKS